MYILVVLLAVFMGCSTPDDKALVGKWKINEFTVIMVNRKTSVQDAEELKKGGAVWDIQLKSNGKFRQDYNMDNPEQKMQTEKGSWTTSGDTLFVQLESKIDGNKIPPIKYIYKFNEEELVLSLNAPRDLGKLITKFVKK